MITGRRSFLQGLVVTVTAGSATACAGDDEFSTDPEDVKRVYPQGIASGDPSASSIILWTRIGDAADGEDIPILYQLARDEAFEDIVLRGAATVTADYDHTIRLKVDLLEPYSTYYYRFIAKGVSSVVGRTRTAPALNQDVAIKFAFASCQDFIGRYYHAWRALAERDEDLDFVLFLGDYVYETNGDSDFQTPDALRRIDIPEGLVIEPADEANGKLEVKAAKTLADYRGLYKQYRSDEHLQRVHARYPFITIWDDHEFANDCWQDHATDFNELQGDEKSPDRRHAASQAWFEFQTADVAFTAGASPPGDLTIYRSLRFGKHLEIVLTDQRSYRSDHVIPEGAAGTDKPAGAPADVPPYSEVGKIFQNSEVFSRNFVRKPAFDLIEAWVKPTMLGDAQKSWFLEKMQSSTATWKIWGNETQLVQMMIDLRPFDIPAPFKGIYYYTVDQWDGFRTERKEIVSALASVSNVVVLTGDIHGFYAAEIAADPDDASSTSTMVEYVTAGITSSSLQEITQGVVDSNPAFSALSPLVAQIDDVLRSTSPAYRHVRSDAYGFALVEVDKAAEVRVKFLRVNDVQNPTWNGEVEETSFRTVAGQSKIEAL